MTGSHNVRGRFHGFANMNAESRVMMWETLVRWRQCWWNQGKVVVSTNGCFDLLRAGLMRCLMAVKVILAQSACIGLPTGGRYE